MDYSGAGNNPTVVLLRGLGLSFLVTFFGQRLLPIIPNIISGAVYRRTLGWFEAGVTNPWKMGVISPGVATQTMPNPKIWQSADRAVGWVIAGTLDDANRCSPGLPILQAQVAGLLFGLLGGASFVSSISPCGWCCAALARFPGIMPVSSTMPPSAAFCTKWAAATFLSIGS